MARGGSGMRRWEQQEMQRAEVDLQDFEEFYNALAEEGEAPQVGGGDDTLTLEMILAYDGNVAELLDSATLTELGEAVRREYEIDDTSRAEWVDCAKEALKAATQKKPEVKNTPYPNAANVKFPLLTTACIQFAARAYPAIVRGDEVVEVKPLGEDGSGEKSKRAQRTSAFVNDQLIYRCPEWEAGTDVLLHALPAIGKAFRKCYWDREARRPRLDYVSALDVVVAADAPSMELAPRVTHILRKYPYQVERLVRAGTWLECEYPNDPSDSQKLIDFLEQVRFEDIDRDGYPEPYVVTIHKETSKVVRIDPAFDVQDIELEETLNEYGEPEPRIVSITRNVEWIDYDFLPDPEGGFYAMGFGQLLAPISATIDTTINQMIDAGHQANTNTGFLSSAVKMRGGEMVLSHNKFKQIQGASDLKSAIYRMEFPGPSQTMMALLEFLITTAKDITSVKDVLTGDAPGTQPATSTLALIEQGLQVFSAIYKRIYRSMTREFEALYRLNARYLSVEEYNRFLDAMPPEEEVNPEANEMQPAGPAPGAPPAQPPIPPPGAFTQSQPGMGQVVPFPGATPPVPGDMAAPGADSANPPGAAASPMPPEMMMAPPQPPMGGALGGAAAPGAGPPPQLQQALAAQLPPTPPQPQIFEPAKDFGLKDLDVRPVADPSAVTEMQRLARASALMQFVNDPFVNQPEIRKRAFEAMRQPDIDKLVVQSNPMADLMAQAQLAAAQAQAQATMWEAKLKEAQAGHLGAQTQVVSLEPQFRTAQIEIEATTVNQDDHRLALDETERAFRAEAEAAKLQREAERDAIDVEARQYEIAERDQRLAMDMVKGEHELALSREQALSDLRERLAEFEVMRAEFKADQERLKQERAELKRERDEMERDADKKSTEAAIKSLEEREAALKKAQEALKETQSALKEALASLAAAAKSAAAKPAKS